MIDQPAGAALRRAGFLRGGRVDRRHFNTGNTMTDPQPNLPPIPPAEPGTLDGELSPYLNLLAESQTRIAELTRLREAVRLAAAQSAQLESEHQQERLAAKFALDSQLLQLRRTAGQLAQVVRALRNVVTHCRCEEGKVPDQKQMKRAGIAFSEALEVLKLCEGIV
jgi:hypothetical protein